MRIFTILFASAVMLGAAIANAQTTPVHKRVKGSFLTIGGYKQLMAQNSPARTFKHQSRAIRKEVSASNFKPEREMVYIYTEYGWQLEGEYTYTYTTNADGSIFNTQTQKSDNEVLFTETSISKDGLTKTIVEKVSEDYGQTFANSTKVVFTYDPIATDLVTMKQRYVWDDAANDWEEISDSFKRDIVRDADNNVTSLTISVPYQGAYDATEKYTNTVDPKTKQITSYKYEQLGYDDNYNPVWSTEQYLTDITWHKTNGQIVSQYDEWMLWGNYLTSASLAYEENGETKTFGHIHVDYMENGDYTETFFYTDEPEMTTTWKTMIDNNGSFQMEEKTSAYIVHDYGEIQESDVKEWTKEEVYYDDHNNYIRNDVYEYNLDTYQFDHIAGEIVDYSYDAKHGGLPERITTRNYDMDLDEYVPFSEVVVTKFVDTTSGISEVKDASQNDIATVYNIQGIAIDRSAINGSGLFIVKKNGKTIKLIK